MKQCPFCHSNQISLIDIKSQGAMVTEISTSMVSPATMAALGASLSKSINIPPFLGALVGAIIGGVFMILTDESDKASHSDYLPMYYCPSCQKHFDATLRTSSPSL